MDRQFIPHPATWFNGEGYDDEETEWTAWKQTKQKNDPFKTIVPIHLFDKDGKPPTIERPIKRKYDE
jgi:predicted amidohydrolase YtcJ